MGLESEVQWGLKWGSGSPKRLLWGPKRVSVGPRWESWWVWDFMGLDGSSVDPYAQWAQGAQGEALVGAKLGLELGDPGVLNWALVWDQIESLSRIRGAQTGGFGGTQMGSSVGLGMGSPWGPDRGFGGSQFGAPWISMGREPGPLQDPKWVSRLTPLNSSWFGVKPNKVP